MKNVLNFGNYKQLNENIHDDLSFTTPITNVSEYFLRNSDFLKEANIIFDDNIDYEITDTLFRVKWSLNIDPREVGIKDMSISINDVKGEFIIVVWINEEENRHHIIFDPEKLGFIVKSGITLSSSIIPSEIEIDFKNKTLSIE